MIRASQEHGATAHPVRTGQPGDRQENAARAGPRLISQASSVVNPKTTTRTLPRPADSTKCAPAPGPPRSQIMPRPPNRIVPELAVKWAWNGDMTALTFQLRRGVSWHDGRPFT